MSKFGMGCPLFDVVHPVFPLPNKALPTSQGGLKDGSGEVVVATDMSEPCKFPSLDSCHKIFLRIDMKVYLAPHRVVGLVLQAGNAEKCPQAFGLPKAWILFSE